MMRLYLASEAKHPDSVKKLEKFAGGFQSKKITDSPTAANGEQAFGDWRKNSETWQLVQTLGAKVSAVQLEDYKNSSVIKLLKSKDIIWFAGGACSYLMYWILRCGINKYLPEILASGTIYVGSSAGSMITAKTLDVAEWYPGEPEIGSHYLPGLGLVDFDIFPHYEDTLLPELKKWYRGNKMYLLKNGEAIAVENKKVTVLGQTRVIP